MVTVLPPSIQPVVGFAMTTDITVGGGSPVYVKVSL
jgi:hypothetical protein